MSPSEIKFSVPSTIFMEVFSAFVTRIAGADLPVIFTPLRKILTVSGSAVSSGIFTLI
ncbi:MAG: hypothetical protein NC177_11535 [Ruminococcus flavefaciens]|nr:hypothetical protein [Ruminococcus flavefaciens]